MSAQNERELKEKNDGMHVEYWLKQANELSCYVQVVKC